MKELEELDAAFTALTKASDAVVSRRADRDRAIIAAYRAGVPITAIAEQVELSASRVQIILGQPHGRVGRPPRTPSHDV